MDRVQKYLFSNFISSFASLFSTLFIIMSIVFFLQIARITSFIEINLIELIKLYLFMLPRILIFTVPIAFFVALSMALFRLSKENETIVLFTIGYVTRKIAVFFGVIAAIFSVLLLFISLVMMPIAENLKDNFIDYKKVNATLNIKASEFGQKFSEWMVFIEGEDEGENGKIYKNLVFYNHGKKGEDERIIIAKKGEFVSENQSFSALLRDGKIYTVDSDEWHITEFDELIIRTLSKSNIRTGSDVLGYWREMRKNDKRKKDFSIYVLVSLFPLASVLFALSFGIVTYRYEKGFIYAGIFGVLFSYFALIMILAKRPQIAISVTFLLTFILSWIYYNFKIKPRY
ncbi:LptF/LptG family permease [Campylobacter sp. VBCF_05 NA6]|uniref:LptF/LptG family permease n=1 Tax=unclassified Campylobacter TaxID=2593542 RepID=UPI0022E9FCBE|nr:MULTISPECIES: LptF/LptG family permease [unclassified Campylobacter]MDA3057062.1 LptF/LptG family permease [Campylobacter sp. VBCF_04 NA7]MDA3059635.1 LptF/LptG family permease [Campylobacter sp. VBCF_05 NA6]